MAYQIYEGFNVNFSAPIDYRMVVANAASRIALSYKYDGLKVTQLDNRITYIWNSGPSTWTIDNSTMVTGTGSSNYIPKVTGTSPFLTLGNSAIYEQVGLVGINSNNPLEALEIKDANPVFANDPFVFRTNSTSKVFGYNFNAALFGNYYVSTSPSWQYTFNPDGTNRILGRPSGVATPYSEIFRMDSTTSQALIPNGSVSLPSFGLISAIGTGIYSPGSRFLSFTINGTQSILINNTQVLIKDGSSSLPSFGFINNPSTGIYSPGVGALSFGVNGTQRMRLLAGGATDFTLYSPTGAKALNYSLYDSGYLPIAMIPAGGSYDISGFDTIINRTGGFYIVGSPWTTIGHKSTLYLGDTPIGGNHKIEVDFNGLFKIHSSSNISLGNSSNVTTLLINNSTGQTITGFAGSAAVPSIALLSTNTGFFYDYRFYCTDPNTPILMSGGLTTRSGDLKVGDLVYTMHETTGEWGDYKITNVEIVSNQIKLLINFTDDTDIIVSNSHKFLMDNNEWKTSISLSIGDSIKGIESNKIVSLITNIGPGDVVSITVEDAHTYVSSGVISHNKVFGPRPGIGITTGGVQRINIDSVIGGVGIGPYFVTNTNDTSMISVDGCITSYSTGLPSYYATGTELRFGAVINAGVGKDVSVNIGTINDSTNTGIIQVFSNAASYPYYGTGPYNLCLQPNGGNVGIYTSSPSYKLHVVGTAYATGAAGALSDVRHKKDIKPIESGLSDIIKLNPVKYKWIDDDIVDSGMEGEHYGFIAQEIQTILPNIVLIQDNEEKTLGLKLTELIPILVKAIQELSDKVKDLENKK